MESKKNGRAAMEKQTEKLTQGLCINLEGWDGEGGGREDRKSVV